MRSQTALRKIKDHINDNPGIYAGHSAAEIAILMQRPISRDPVEYNTITPDVLEVLKEKLETIQIERLKTFAIADTSAKSSDFDDIQIEIKDRQCDLLELGDISQGDVEGALT